MSAPPTFATATVLARKGRYSEALRVLREVFKSGDCSEVEAQDLKARIYAQQGDYLMAEACWRRALELEPGNPDFERPLVCLRRSQGRWSRVRTALGITVIVSLTVFILVEHLYFNSATRAALATLVTQDQLDRAQETNLSASRENQALMAHTVESLQLAIDNLRGSLSDHEKKIDSRDAALVVRLNQLDSNLRSEIKSSSSAGEIKAAKAAVAELNTRQAAIGAQLEELKRSTAARLDYLWLCQQVDLDQSRRSPTSLPQSVEQPAAELKN